MSKKRNRDRNRPDEVSASKGLGDAEEMESPAPEGVGGNERAALAEPMNVPEADLPPVEDQSTRWIKYGVNVLLTSVVVILLAGIFIWISNGSVKMTEKAHGRLDLTSDSSNKLHPQTVQLLKDLPSDVTLVSLYPKLKKEEAANKGADTYQRVLDVLDEYRRNGKNIKVETIDPVNDPVKLAAWIAELKLKYGKNIENYEKFFKELPKQLEEIKGLAKAEADELDKMRKSIESQPVEKLSPEQEQQIALIDGLKAIIEQRTAELPRLTTVIGEELQKPIPDYALAVTIVKNGFASFSGGVVGLSRVAQTFEGLSKRLEEAKDSTQLPEAFKKYAVAAAPRFKNVAAKPNELLKKTEELGELKLDEVRKKILPSQEGDTQPPAIAVMTDSDVKVIEDSRLWKSGEATGMLGPTSSKPKLRFAGEQQLTSAILSISQKTKQKIAFIRAGGAPLVGGGFGRPGQFSEVAERLRNYNFDVVEKDIMSGMGRPQQPNPNEPTDEELKQAIWVAVVSQSDPQMGMMAMPGMLADRIKQHLEGGGSALVMVTLRADDVTNAFKDWGIEVKSDTIIVHEPIEGGDPEAGDFIEGARRVPYIFVLNEYGDHPITTPLRSLDSGVVELVPVRKAATVPADVKVTEIIPIPTTPKSWGETDISSLSDRNGGPGNPEFNADKDMAGPLFAGAVAEKQGKGRLVVLGSPLFAVDQIVRMPDKKAYDKSKMIVSRFPGNGELITNSVFWLAKNEKMIALSPSAMDAARIEAVPAGKLGFIKVGVVLVILPLLAVAAGIGVFLTRRNSQ